MPTFGLPVFRKSRPYLVKLAKLIAILFAIGNLLALLVWVHATYELPDSFLYIIIYPVTCIYLAAAIYYLIVAPGLMDAAEMNYAHEINV